MYVFLKILSLFMKILEIFFLRIINFYRKKSVTLCVLIYYLSYFLLGKSIKQNKKKDKKIYAAMKDNENVRSFINAIE